MDSEARRIETAHAAAGVVSGSASDDEANRDRYVIALDRVVIRLGRTTADEWVARLAEHQRGRVARRQLLAAGVDRHAIDRRIRSRRLIVVHAGVYLVGHTAPVPLGAETAALLAMREPGALSHHSAAERWELPPAHDRDRRVHVTVPGGEGGHPDGVAPHRSVILVSRDIRVRDELPVTSPERTILDLAATGSARETERNVDHALRTTPMTLTALTRLLARAGRHPGRGPLTELLAHRGDRDTFTRSEAEEPFLRLVREAGLPQPLVNVRRHGYEIDFLWPEHGVAVEVDGFATHGDRGSFERDRRKGADLHAEGIVLTRITWRQMHDEPLRLMVGLAQTLHDRRPR